jgi:hypothetical protein
MPPPHFHAATALTLTALVAAMLNPDSAHALQGGANVAGVRYLAGGANQGDRRDIAALRHTYSVFIQMAGQAAFPTSSVQSVRVLIKRRDTRNVIFSERVEGPWLLVDLWPGDYEIAAHAAGASPPEALLQWQALRLSAAQRIDVALPVAGPAASPR